MAERAHNLGLREGERSEQLPLGTAVHPAITTPTRQAGTSETASVNFTGILCPQVTSSNFHRIRAAHCFCLPNLIQIFLVVSSSKPEPLSQGNSRECGAIKSIDSNTPKVSCSSGVPIKFSYVNSFSIRSLQALLSFP